MAATELEVKLARMLRNPNATSKDLRALSMELHNTLSITEEHLWNKLRDRIERQ